MADLAFGAWAQTTIGAAVDHTDAGQTDLGVATFTPGATIVGPAGQTRPVQRTGALEMMGPGGVSRVDGRTVVRTTPAPGTFDATANDLVAIELVPPELPWLLTPASAAGTRRLRPWLALVVVGADVPFDHTRQPLPVVQAPTDQLPDLGESWAWAHVQGPPGGGASFARLLCPRRLDEGVHYRACLVPAFEAGRLAGLVTTSDSTDHGPAWQVSAVGRVELPVFYSWEFATAVGGDFEDLVRRLSPADDLASLGSHEIDIHAPWPDGQPLAGLTDAGTIRVRGATVPIGAPMHDDEPTSNPVSPATMHDFFGRLSRQVNIAADRLAGGDDPDPDDTIGAVTPPIYGGRHILDDRVEPNPELPLADLGWLTELNLHPANRIAAGLGAEYVRQHQEQLMARAWAQVGAIREANRLRALAELASTVANSMHRRHVEQLDPAGLVAFAAPAAARTSTGGPTLRMEVGMSPLPDAAMSSTFARVLRRHGPIAKRASTTAESILGRGLLGDVTVPEPRPVFTPAEASAALATTLLTPLDVANRLVLLDGARRVAEMNDLGAGAELVASAIGAMDGLDPAAMEAGDVMVLAAEIEPQLDVIRQALVDFTSVDLSAAQAADGRALGEFGVPIRADSLASRLSDALAPGPRHEERLRSRVTMPTSIDRSGLQPVMACPSFPAPMALALLDGTPDWFLPGLGGFPAERVALLGANDRFIESYFAGLNHEMMRELLWREYPTDQRGSPFLHFWPRASIGDIPPLHEWDRALGDNVRLQGEDFALVLVRGEVVRRHRSMIVSAIKAVRPDPNATHPVPSADPGDVRPTMFVVPIDESTSLYALSVGPAQLATAQTIDDPGWFIVFQEHDYRMRFGFDRSNDTVDSWDDLDWTSVDPAGRGFATVGVAIQVDVNPLGLRWGPTSDATHIARISLQKPFRVAIHANRLIRMSE